MVTASQIPRIDQPIADGRGSATKPWLDFFLLLASQSSDDSLRALYEGLAARVAQLEDESGITFQVLAGVGIVIQGVPQNGVITIGLNELGDTGVGAALVKITRDAYGRVEGTEAATTDDLPEGLANLYHTDERAQDAVGAIVDGTGDVRLAYDDATPKISATLSPEVLDSLALADTALQEVRPGTGIAVDNTDPQRPVVSSTVSPGIPDAPATYPHARRAGAWQPLDGPESPYYLLKLAVLTDQAGNVLTDQAGNVLTANLPELPYAWLTGVPTYRFPPMTLAQANALAGVQDGQPVLITDLAGGREPCWYDITVVSGTKWRRFSDRSIAN